MLTLTQGDKIDPVSVPQGMYGGMNPASMAGFAPYSPYAMMVQAQQMQQLQQQLGAGGGMGAPYGVYGGPAAAASPYDGGPYGRGAGARASAGAAAGYGYSMRPSQYAGGGFMEGDHQGAAQGFDPQQQYAAYQQTQPPAPGQRNPEPWPPRDYRS